METGVLTKILKRFIIYLEVLPENLRLFCFSVLFFLITIDTALVIYNNLGNTNFSYIEWGKKKILKVGFIMFALYKYEWFLAGIKNFFFYAVEKSIKVSFLSSEYFDNPSLLYSQGQDLAQYIYKEGMHWYSLSSWIYGVMKLLILIGYMVLMIQLIICWIEYYFLTGFSIIFLPFGALDMTLEYYKNVFKVIMGSTIKLAVMNLWLVLSSVILKDLFEVTKHKPEFSFDFAGLIIGVLYVVVAVMQVLPSLTSGLLTGSPTINASAAMAGVGASFAALGNKVKSAYHAARGTFETGRGAVKGAQIGAKLGGSSPIGVVTGAAGAVIGGSYAGLKYYATKKGLNEDDDKDSKKKKSKEDSKSESTGNTSTENKSPSTSTSTSNKNATKSETISKQNQNSQTANNSNSTTNNSSTNVNENIGKTSANQEAGKPNNSSSTNSDTTSRTKENLPNWAKEDYK